MLVLDEYITFLDGKITKGLSLAVALIDKCTGKQPIGYVRVFIQDQNLKAIKNRSEYYLFFDLLHGTYSVQTKSNYYLDEKNAVNLPRPVDFAFPPGGGVSHGSTETVLDNISGLRDRDVLEFDNESDPPERRMIFLDPDPTTNKIHWDTDPRDGLEYDYDVSAKIRLPVPENLIIRIVLKPKPSYPFPSGATLIRGMVQDSDGNPVSEAKVEVAGKKVSNRTTVKGEFVLYFKALTEDDIIIEDSKKFVKGNGDKTICLEATHDSKIGTAELKEVEEGKTTSLKSPIILS